VITMSPWLNGVQGVAGGAAPAYGDARSASQQIPPSRLELSQSKRYGMLDSSGLRAEAVDQDAEQAQL